AEAIFKQFQLIAQAENKTLSALLKVTIFITSFEDIDALRHVLFHYYGDHLPASSLVQVSALFSPDIKIEIVGIIALLFSAPLFAITKNNPSINLAHAANFRCQVNT
ncbi:Rid family hydrolase, partial [Xanthomonas citri pv. citri]